MYNLATVVQAFFYGMLRNGNSFDLALDITSKMREYFVQGDEYLEFTTPEGYDFLIMRTGNVYDVFQILQDGLCRVNLGV